MADYMDTDYMDTSQLKSLDSPLLQDWVTRAAERVKPCVLYLTTKSGKFLGSGFVSAPKSALTAGHCVQPPEGFSGKLPPREVYVFFEDGRRVDGIVTNVYPGRDIARLKLDVEEPLPCIKWGNSSKLCYGDHVVAIGSPADFPFTVTSGIVSCPVRSNIEARVPFGGVEYLQTTCVTSQGGSGGPLINIDGEVIGMITNGFTPGGGLNFAATSDFISKTVDDFDGINSRPCLGIYGRDLDANDLEDLKGQCDLYADINGGVYVNVVITDSAADGKFKEDDCIIMLHGTYVESQREIYEEMLKAQRSGAASLKVTVIRAGGIKTFDVTPKMELNPLSL